MKRDDRKRCEKRLCQPKAEALIEYRYVWKRELGGGKWEGESRSQSLDRADISRPGHDAHDPD